MSVVVEIPLIQGPQSFFIDLSGTTYQIKLTYRDLSGAGPMADQGGWIMDIGDQGGVPVVCGIPLVTGTNLIAPFTDLFLPPGGIFVASESPLDKVPTFEALGAWTHLYYVPPDAINSITAAPSTLISGGSGGSSGGAGTYVPVWGA